MHTVIVGAGSAGGAVASRLVERGESVTLIEAGPDYPTLDAMPASLLDPFNPDIVFHDWGLRAFPTESSPDGHMINYPRGKLVGGSSAVNGAAAGRGMPADFDEWVAAGNPGWSWNDVVPYFARLESDREFGRTIGHGDRGPIPIVREDRSTWPASMRAFEEACLKFGHGAFDDYNADGRLGVVPLPRNQMGALRASALVTYLAAVRDDPNLTLIPNTTVRRVIFEGRRAVGLEVRGPEGDRVISADRVILSAGAINTPHLLTLSGVGRRRVLDELGIEPVVNREGVGRRLIDHPYVPLTAVPTDQADDAFGFKLALRWRTSADDGDALMMALPCLIDTASVNFEVVPELRSLLLFPVEVAKPRSVGSLTTVSPDPDQPPLIRLNFLDDPGDLRAMMAGVRTLYEIMTSAEMAPFLHSVAPGPDVISDDVELERFVKANVSTGYHAVGSCPMGPEDDPLAVVDERLKVLGTESLYIADASVMPTIPFGLTNLTSYMIGERFADLLTADDHRERTS